MPSWPSSAVVPRKFRLRKLRLRPDHRLIATLAPLLLLLYSRVLITTDVWARGIDVQQVSLVINYDLPSYVFFA